MWLMIISTVLWLRRTRQTMIHVVGVPNPDLVESTIRTYMHNIITFSGLVPRLLPMPKSGESLGMGLGNFFQYGRSPGYEANISPEEAA